MTAIFTFLLALVLLGRLRVRGRPGASRSFVGGQFHNSVGSRDHRHGEPFFRDNREYWLQPNPLPPRMNDVYCSEITGTIYGVDAAYVGSGSQTCFAG